MEMLLQYLDSIHTLSAGCKETLATGLLYKAISKKELLLRAGHICQHIYFIQKGLMRRFYFKNDVEICSWFFKEGDIMLSVESFFKQVTSYESIQAMENCELYYIGYRELQEIFGNFSEFNFIFRVLLEKHCCLSERRLYSFRMMRASERYEYLEQHHPELILRVPGKYIASYLGITSEMLSKIKGGKNRLFI